MAITGILKVKNGEVPFIRFGEGKKILVVLPGLSYDDFFDKAEDIEKSYSIFHGEFTVYLIDRNLYPKENYSIEDMAFDTIETLEKSGLNEVYLYGVSMGGMVAQKIAIEKPELVKKLVLCSTLSRKNETMSKVLTRWQSLAKTGDISSLASDMNKTIYSAETLEKYATVLNNIKITATPEKTFRFVTYIEAGKNFDDYSSLLKITAKTFVIGERNDKVTTVIGAREIAKKLNCDYYEYNRFGHAVFDEAPDCKERIFKFLTEK